MGEVNLSSVSVNSGVNERGEPHCHVLARGEGNTVLIGQLSPAEVRATAMQWLEAAEAAEQDAALLRLFRKLDLPDTTAAAVIGELRDSREGGPGDA